MRTLYELEPLLKHVGQSLKFASNAIERNEQLRLSLPATVPGQPRMFNRLHAIQLITMAAFVTAGARPKRAQPLAAAIVRGARAPGPLREWMVFPAGKFEKGAAIATNEPNLAALNAEFGSVPLSLVPIGAIVRMIDQLYAEE